MTAEPESSSRLPPIDRHFWLVALLSTVVLLARAAMIMSAHTEIMDSQFHLRSGLALLTGNPGEIRDPANDAPLGQVLMALPMVLTGNTPDKPISPATWASGVPVPGGAAAGEAPLSPKRAKLARTIRRPVMYGNAMRPETILLVVGLWKSLLFVPAVIIAFQWCRAVYGTASGWLASALLLFDPTIAAHVPIIALDTLGVEGILIACFCLWHYFERPGTRSLVVASVAMALGVLLKHTAVILPAVAGLFALYYWGLRPWRDGTSWPAWRAALRDRLNAVLLAALVFCFAIWALTGFDLSPPSAQYAGAVGRTTSASRIGDAVMAALDRPLPAGVYVGRFVSGLLTSGGGHWAYLWGEARKNGWWYYFPVVATYKVPIGFGIVILLSLASLAWVRPRRGEVSMLIPLVAWGALLLGTHLNIGFRHFLPAHVFVLMLASRCVAGAIRWPAIVAWVGVALGVVHGFAYHPDYLSYINHPRRQWWLHITESNVDWGQAIRQTRRWLDARPELESRGISFAPRWDRQAVSVKYYLDDRVTLIDRGSPPPRRGLLIISPIWVTGVYDEGKNPYAFLHALEPVDMIGHSLLVYDLDREPKR